MAGKIEMLRRYNERRHEETLERVRLAIRAIRMRGQRLSYYRIAKVSGVSKTTLYKNDDIKRLIEAEREADRRKNGIVLRFCAYRFRRAS